MLRFFKGLLSRKVKELHTDAPYKIEAPVVAETTEVKAEPAPAKVKKARAPAKPNAEKKPAKPRAKKAEKK